MSDVTKQVKALVAYYSYSYDFQMLKKRLVLFFALKWKWLKALLDRTVKGGKINVFSFEQEHLKSVMCLDE